MNMYGFASGDPVNFTDPLGLCKRPRGNGVGICFETFIKGRFGGYGDNRDFSGTGGTYRTSTRFSLDPTSGRVSDLQNRMGFTHGEGRGVGGLSASVESDGASGWNVELQGEAVNGSGWGPMIDYSIQLHVSETGEAELMGRKHDGFPSYELWVYGKDGRAVQLYGHEQGQPFELVGKGDVRVPRHQKQ